ncbi:MbeB family mobilization protein [uncultured Kushneria sp.]|uniref:MbeB family mobilization protein n=1 Tax=uncultured Kushneria sp. TaxID=905033 RepID=UPI00260B3C36|nr:MbeB family mobilization protein [uncultured Kushneria sp.]
MSDISRMAAAFEEKSKQQAESTEQAVKHAFEKHENALLLALNESEQRTSAAIAAQHQRLRQTALKSWMAIVIPVSLMFLLGTSAIMTMGWYIDHQVNEILNNRTTLEMLHERGGSADLNHCGEDRRLCVKIDESAQHYQGGYRIMEGY